MAKSVALNSHCRIPHTNRRSRSLVLVIWFPFGGSGAGRSFVVIFIVIVIDILVVLFRQLCAGVVIVALLGRVTLIRVFSSPLEVRLHVEIVIFTRGQLILFVGLVKVVVERVIVVAWLAIEVFRVIRYDGLILFLLFCSAAFAWRGFFLSVLGLRTISSLTNFLALCWLSSGFRCGGNLFLLLVPVCLVLGRFLRGLVSFAERLLGLTFVAKLSVLID